MATNDISADGAGRQPAIAGKDCRHGKMMFLRGDTYMTRCLEHYGEYSEGEGALFARLIGPGQIVADVGAHIGAHALHMAKLVGPSGIVLAFEPQRILFQLLCANMVMNEQFHVRTYHAAVGAVSGSLKVPQLDYTASFNFGSLSLGTFEIGDDVSLIPLDSLGLPSLRLLKVDCEGMELEALLGAERTIARHRPILYVENDRPEKSERLIALISAMGYDVWWHLPQMFNPDNFAGAVEDVFPGLISINLLCAPKESSMDWPELRRVTGPSDHWRG